MNPRASGPRRFGRLRRARVERFAQDDTLLLRPGYTAITVYALLGLGMLVAVGFILADGHARAGVVAGGLVIGLGALGFTAWAARAREPLLTVSHQGISAPMTSSGTGLISWARIARVYPLHIWARGLAVEVWRDPDDHPAGTRSGLFVPGGMWPMRVSRLLREIDQRQPPDRPSPLEPSP